MAVGSDSCSPCSKLVCCLSYIPFHLFDSAASIVAPGTTRRRHSAWRPARLGAGGRQCEPGPSPVTAGLLDCQRAVLRSCLTRQYSAHASACRLFGNANQNPRPSRWGCSAVNGLLCAFDTRSVVRYGAHDHGCGHAESALELLAWPRVWVEFCCWTRNPLRQNAGRVQKIRN
jgi:hypothetical protein